MSERKFKIGDRIHHKYADEPGHGTITNYNMDHPLQKVYFVLFDKKPSYVEGDNRAVSAYEDFMTLIPKLLSKPLSLSTDDPKWETSYTKKVYDAIGRIPALKLSLNEFSAVCDALDLLEQYHADMAIPYKQRDAARAEVASLRAERDNLLKERETLKMQSTAQDLVTAATLHFAKETSRLDTVAALGSFRAVNSPFGFAEAKKVSQLNPKDYPTFLESLITRAMDIATQRVKDAVQQVIS